MNDNDIREVIIDCYGEGKTDTFNYDDDTHVLPNEGVLVLLTHKLCNYPQNMRVKRRKLMSLIGKSLAQKVKLAKRKSKESGSNGCIFVLDTDGKNKLDDMVKGRDLEHKNFPMAVGVAHPAIEAWLLSDTSAIRRGVGLEQKPEEIAEPEKIGEGQKNPQRVVKETLDKLGAIRADEKSAIAKYLDVNLAKQRCPSFLAFAVEVETHLLPLFNITKTIANEEIRES